MWCNAPLALAWMRKPLLPRGAPLHNTVRAVTRGPWWRCGAWRASAGLHAPAVAGRRTPPTATEVCVLARRKGALGCVAAWGGAESSPVPRPCAPFLAARRGGPGRAVLHRTWPAARRSFVTLASPERTMQQGQEPLLAKREQVTRWLQNSRERDGTREALCSEQLMRQRS